MSGLAYWSHDIGGFWGDPSPELYVRWAQLGFLSALSRYHGATPRDPWLFGEEALAIFREYARLRSRLVPYLVSHGREAAETGMPLMRPMALEFPDDPAGYAFDLQYCLGRELLVSPVVRARGWVTTYLPPGRWLDWWSGAVPQGPQTLRRQVPLRELPLYLRENSLLVLGPERSHVGERPADPLTVEAFVSRGDLRAPRRRRPRRPPAGGTAADSSSRSASVGTQQRARRRPDGRARMPPRSSFACATSSPPGRAGRRPAPAPPGSAGLERADGLDRRRPHDRPEGPRAGATDRVTRLTPRRPPARSGPAGVDDVVLGGAPALSSAAKNRIIRATSSGTSFRFRHWRRSSSASPSGVSHSRI